MNPCPHCGRSAGFLEREAEVVERHGLDCPPYEQYYQRWLECKACGAPIQEDELDPDPDD